MKHPAFCNGTVLFLHIPKAAGSTLSTIIQRQYQPEAVYKSYGTVIPAAVRGKLTALESARYRYARLEALPLTERARIKLFIGHEGFGFHQLFSPPTTYITLLRDPIERVISHYYYARSHPGNRLYKTIVSNEMSLAQFVASGLSVEVDNGQTKYLAGLETPYLHEGEYGADLLAQAKQNLREHFSVVGLTEEFDASLLLLKRTLGWKIPLYARVNVTQKRPFAEQISPATLVHIKKQNYLDLELYQFARQLFEAQVEQQGAGFQRELKWFERLNGVYGRYRSAHALFYNQAKKIRNLSGRINENLAHR
jgi:hypothetical protein